MIYPRAFDEEDDLARDTFRPTQTPLQLAPDPADPVRTPIVLREVAITSRFDLCEERVIIDPDYVPPAGAVLSLVTAVSFGHVAAPEWVEFDVERYRDGTFIGRVCSPARLRRLRDQAAVGETRERVPEPLEAAEEQVIAAAFAALPPVIAEDRRITWSIVSERLTEEGCLRRHELIDGVERITSLVQVVGRSLVEIPEEEWLSLSPRFTPGMPVELLGGPPAAMAVGGDPRGLPPRG
jgi:hypothetical protein